MKYVFKKKINNIAALLIDAIGYFVFSFFRKQPHSIPDGIKAILVIRLDHLGDLLLSTATPKALKENFSKARVIFLASSWSASLLENNPFVDEVILYDAPWFSRKRYKKNSNTHNIFGLINILREKKIDLALGLRGDLRENLMMFFAGIKERVGYGVTGGGFFLTKEVTYRKDVHESIHQLDLLNALGIRCTSLEPKLYFNDAEIAHFSQRLERLGILKDDKFIGFLVGAGSCSKEWPVDNVNFFLECFLNKFPRYKVALVGSSVRLSNLIKNTDKTRIINLIGETSLRELGLLIRRSSVFIGADSGPTHMAAVLGIPSIFLYSGTNCFEQWRPLAEFAVVLRNPVPCSPCELEICPVEGHPCMSGISPEDVLKVLDKKL